MPATQTSLEILEKLRKIKPILQEKWGITRLRVFGSVARGEAGPDSDVDLIADLSRPLGWSFFTLDQKISDLLDGRKVDFPTEDGLHRYLKQRILNEAQDV
jgi:predicted nucleotidyltransferase